MVHVYINEQDMKTIKKAAKVDRRSISSFFAIAAKDRSDKILHIVEEGDSDEF